MAQTSIALTRSVNGVDAPLPGTYVLDTSHTHIGFAARHLMVSKVRGRFTAFSGTITVAEDPAESTVDVAIEAGSIDTRDEQRDGHLRSPDFLDVEKRPELTFQSTTVKSMGGDRWIVEGDLTVREATRPVQLEVTFEGATGDPWGNTRIGLSAKGELDREDFGLTWNVALETGGVLVGKRVVLEIEAEAIRQP
jgi:polyisoprenoid-binding protein YceI